MVLRKRGDIIAKNATTIAIVNQKGGTAKTTTCENLGIGLAMEGKKVLLVDVDPQGSLTISMGWQQPDELPTTLSTLMQKAMNDQPIQPGKGILHHAEGVDLIPANIELAGMEVALVNSMNREKMLKQVLDSAKREYDYILLDCTPSLGMLTVNALAAADTDSDASAVPLCQRSGTALADDWQSSAADKPQAENRGYPADHDRQPHQLWKANQQSDSAGIRKASESIRPDHSSVCSCC